MKKLNILSYCLLSISCFGQTINITNVTIGTLTIVNSVAGGGASWTPTDEASLVAWFKADVGVTNAAGSLASDGDTVKGWMDNGTHSNFATNVLAGTTRPIYKSNQQNSLPCIRFDGSDDELRADNIYTTYVSGNDTPMIWGMAYRNGVINIAGIWFQGIKSSGEVTFLRAEIDGSNRYFCTRNDGTNDANVYVDWPVDTNGWHVVVWKYDGATAEWWHDGVSVAAAQAIDVGPMDTPGSDKFFIGTDNGGVNYGGDMGEILIFNSASVDPTNVFTYLQGRWNTPISLPDTCLTVFYTNSVASNNFSSFSAGQTYFGVLGWDPGATTNICSFKIKTKLATGVQYRASIWSQSGNNLAVQQGGGQWSQTITGTGSYQELKWNFATSVTATNGTNYALVMSPLTGTLSGAENIYQGGDTAAYSSGWWDSGGTLQGSSTRDPKFAVFKP